MISQSGIPLVIRYIGEDGQGQVYEVESGGKQLFWNLYPDSIKQYFIRAFTTGIFDPENGRVRENELKSVLLQLRDLVFSCPQCNSQVFFDPPDAYRIAGLEDDLLEMQTSDRHSPGHQDRNPGICRTSRRNGSLQVPSLSGRF